MKENVITPLTREEIELFIYSTLHSIASSAYEAFLLRGRGAVVMDLRNATSKDINSYICDSKYFELGGKEPEMLKGLSVSLAILQGMATYDPTKEVVCIVISGDRLHNYKMDSDPTPVQCYLNNFAAARPKQPQHANLN